LETVTPAGVCSGDSPDLSSIHRRERALVHLAMATSLAVDLTNRAAHQVLGNKVPPPLGSGPTSGEDARASTVTRTKQMKQNEIA
jgi:hypothetical protein